MSEQTRWVTDNPETHSQSYVAHFRRLAAKGDDLAGEARLLDALVPPGSHVLDAGCGTGRTGAVLHARGHRVVGVDADPVLVGAAREDHEGPTWLVADLSALDLADHGVAEPFDGAVMAGNVMVFVAPGSEQAVLAGVGRHLAPGAPLVTGFATDRHYDLIAFDDDAEAAGFCVEHRFSTWDLKPYRADGDFAVTILRRLPG
ncbi:MAG: class I SAM-dependent methyltransferase [Candidatus Nanopelagicales bacterium]